MKRIRTDGDVPVSGSVLKERLITIGRVVVAGVVYERLRSVAVLLMPVVFALSAS